MFSSNIKCLGQLTPLVVHKEKISGISRVIERWGNMCNVCNHRPVLALFEVAITSSDQKYFF